MMILTALWTFLILIDRSSLTCKLLLHKFPSLLLNRGVLCMLTFLVAFVSKSEAQFVPSTSKDSSTLISDSSVVKKHSVKKATLLSAVLPGAGQVYNQKIWKVPIIYAAFAGMGYLIHINNKNFNLYQDALFTRYDEDPNTTDEFKDIYTDENLRALTDFYRRNRDLSVIGLSVVYVLNIIDAHVDAHLFYFNVDDDISMQWSPLVLPGPGYATTGLSLSLKF